MIINHFLVYLLVNVISFGALLVLMVPFEFAKTLLKYWEIGSFSNAALGSYNINNYFKKNDANGQFFDRVLADIKDHWRFFARVTVIEVPTVYFVFVVWPNLLLTLQN